MFITDSFCYIPECFLGNAAGKESICKEGDPGLIPGWGSSPGEGTEYPLQYPCLENPYGQRSLEGYSPWSCKESNKTERLSTANRHPKLTQHCKSTISLVQFSNSVISTSLGPNGLQHTRLPCPSPPPRDCSNLCPLSPWPHPTISSSVIPFSSCLQSFPASSHQVAQVLQVQVQHQSFHKINYSPINLFFN